MLQVKLAIKISVSFFQLRAMRIKDVLVDTIGVDKCAALTSQDDAVEQ